MKQEDHEPNKKAQDRTPKAKAEHTKNRSRLLIRQSLSEDNTYKQKPRTPLIPESTDQRNKTITRGDNTVTDRTLEIAPTPVPRYPCTTRRTSNKHTLETIPRAPSIDKG